MQKKIKCVVWDLDNTIWDGVLSEDEHVRLKDGICEIIKELDGRGIVQSIASKNNDEEAMKKLTEFELDEYFIYPRINWNTKAKSIEEIAGAINIGIDTLAFVDDQITEREEVSFSHPEVLTIDAVDYMKMPDMEALTPNFITEDSRKRRLMYKSDMARNDAEEEFSGTSEEFLDTLDMRLTISSVKPEDLKRVEELTVRTNQLNSTGYTYSYDELIGFIDSGRHIFLIAELQDKFGDYGKVGLALLEMSDGDIPKANIANRDVSGMEIPDGDGAYIIKLLLMSCRVMTKGVGSAMLVHLIKTALKDKKDLYAEFLGTSKNRVMYITYKFMGFNEVQPLLPMEEDESDEDVPDGDKPDKEDQILFKYESDIEREYPRYFKMILE